MTVPRSQIPLNREIVDAKGRVTTPWAFWFQTLYSLAPPVGGSYVIDGSYSTYGQTTLFEGIDAQKGAPLNGYVYVAIDTGKIYTEQNGSWQVQVPAYSGDASSQPFSTTLVLSANQPNIQTLPNLTEITVSGNATAGNVIATVNFIGNGALLSNLNGANVTGFVANANIANTVRNNAQPNITSLGTLLSLSVSGNANIGNVGTQLLAATSISSSGNIQASGNLIVGGRANVSGNLGVNNVFAVNLSATGNVQASGNLTVINYVTTGFKVGNSSANFQVLAGGYTKQTRAANIGISAGAPFWNIKAEDYTGDDSGIYLTSVDAGGATGKYLSGDGVYYNSGLWRTTANKTVATAIGLNGGNLKFYTDSGLTPETNYTPTQRMVILNSGNVGIANTSPANTLSINGTLYVQSNANIGNINTGAISATGNIDTSGNLNATNRLYYQRTFGHFTSNTTQTNPVANATNYMAFNNTEFSDGISISSNNQITIARTGYYNIQFSSVFQHTVSQAANVEIWLKKNGSDIANTNTVITILKDDKSVAAWNWLINSANANDYFQIAWLSSDTSVSMIATDSANTTANVAVPSVIATITPVGA